ncbi:MAG: hypothetical protein J0L50_12100 [Sphingomonadales bacterium]|nr:hypothetical protein [Sphingomonadales bacterium]
MRVLFAAALALGLSASPALAQSITDTDADALLAKMSTPAFDDCIGGDQANSLPAQQRFDACQKALTELADYRRKNPKATPGEKQVHLFYEFAVEMGRSTSLIQLNEPDMSKGCANIERQWALTTKFDTSVVGPSMKENLGGVTEAVRPLVQLCRQQFPAPKGAPPA